MEVLDFKWGEGKLIDNPQLGTAIVFIQDQVKDMSENEFFIWVAELYVLGYTEKVYKGVQEFFKKFPRLHYHKFKYDLQIVSDIIYFENKEKVDKLIDLNTLVQKLEKLKENKLAMYGW